MHRRRSAAATAIAFLIAIAVTHIYTTLPSLVRNTVWLHSSRTFRKLLDAPAPISRCYIPADRPDAFIYLVTLESGYSLDQHKQTIGRAEDLDGAIRNRGVIMSDPVFGNITIYEVTLIDETLLAAVRSDLGVLWMECQKPKYSHRGWESRVMG